MMRNVVIYFPRMNENFHAEETPQLSAYATWLKYTKASEDYIALLKLARGGNFPIIRNSQLFFEEIEPEKTFSHLMGIYYEEYYFDNLESMLQYTLKNLKMRIVAPLIFLKGSAMGCPDIYSIAVIACGYNQKNIIALHPEEGKYFEIDVKQYAFFDNQTKMIMCNVPGMSKIAQLDKVTVAIRAIEIYLKRFYHSEIPIFADCIGYKAFLSARKNSETQSAYIRHLNSQIVWLKQASAYSSLLRHDTQKQLNFCIKLYQKAQASIDGT